MAIDGGGASARGRSRVASLFGLPRENNMIHHPVALLFHEQESGLEFTGSCKKIQTCLNFPSLVLTDVGNELCSGTGSKREMIRSDVFPSYDISILFG